MTQLIITIIAIALTAALVLASISYVPAWYGFSNTAQKQVSAAMPLLEQTYDVLTRAAGGTPPAVQGGSDGGFRSLFLPTLKFAPAAPAGYTWVYGQHANDGSRYANLNYFCLSPLGSTSEGVGRGIYRAAGVFSADQMFINSGCGATSTLGQPGNWKGISRAVTFYVAYTPGVTR